jgi:outer membrane protein assembly factor BamB
VVFVSLDGNLFALNLRTGVQIWHGAVGGSLDENTPTVANGVVYVASNDGNLYAFSATGCGGSSGALCPSLWSQKVTSTGTAAPPVIANGFVYVSSGDGVVYAFDTKPSTAPVKRPRLSELRRARTG